MFCGEVIFMFLSEFGGGSQCLKCVKFSDIAPFSVLFIIKGSLFSASASGFIHSFGPL